MRRMPVRRRSRPTMSCEVGPTGLSRLTTPSIGPGELALALSQDLLTGRLERRRHRAARRPRMPAAPKCGGDGHGIGPLGGAYADPRAVRLGLLEQDRDVGGLGR